jgi:DNA-binding NarL/FixJ family response regulator
MDYFANSTTRVLVVEDALMIATRLVELLEDQGNLQLVGSVATAREAIELFDQEPIDAVLLDLQLLDCSGLEVVSHIRHKGSDCLVVVLTNFDGESYQQRCLAAGADYFLHKAFEFERAVGLVRDHRTGRESIA